MKRIKIAFFAEILIEAFDGASRTMFQILRRIPNEKFEFLFICGVGPDQIFGYKCLRLPTLTIPFNSTYKMAIPALAKGKINSTLAVFDPDVIHIATPSMLGNFALHYAHEMQKPVISIYHTHFISYVDYYLRRLPFLIGPVKASIARQQTDFYNRCDMVYVPAESIATELVGMGITPDRIKIWKRGIDTSLFNPEKRHTAILSKITGNELPVVLFASRLVWEKNLEILIQVYILCQKRNLPFNFLIVGDGVARASCEKRMPKAIFLGNTDHQMLSQIYASADIFLFPSISESYGNVVMEAMASGLPCVIADGGGSQDFIEQGINGFKCMPNTPEDFVEKINKLLEDKPLWSRISQAGRLYSQQYSWKELVNSYFEDVAFLSKIKNHTACNISK